MDAKQTSWCRESFRKAGAVCGGCASSSKCSMEKVKFLSEFLEKVDPGKNIKTVQLRGV